MSVSRRLFLNLVFVALIGGSLYDIARDEEHWPFSQYPMFNGVWRAPAFKWLRVFGVTPDGHEFPLDSNRYIYPFDQSRLPKALRRVIDEPERTPRLREALGGVLSRYHSLADEHAHDGPRLAAVRLYELEYAIGVAPHSGRETHRRFIAEAPAR